MGMSGINEADYLLRKHVECPCCGEQVFVLQLKTNKTRRLEPDLDLRPRCREFDTLKYGVISCNSCGYSALRNSFELLTSAHRKLLKENFCPKYKSVDRGEPEYYTHAMALDLHKLALVNAMESRARVSERAYLCLLIAWLNRGAREEIEEEQKENANDRNRVRITMLKAEEDRFLAQAYQGFVEALASETPPFCGLDLHTTEYLVAALAWEQKDTETAKKTISKLIVDRTISHQLKDKARKLKDLILEEEKTNITE